MFNDNLRYEQIIQKLMKELENLQDFVKELQLDRKSFKGARR